MGHLPPTFFPNLVFYASQSGCFCSCNTTIVVKVTDGNYLNFGNHHEKYISFAFQIIPGDAGWSLEMIPNGRKSLQI